MRLRKLARHAREAWEVPRDLLLRRYPEFVTGGPLPKGQVPVFVFHSLEPETFGRKLRYLSENGYVTLSAEEYFQVLMGSRPAPDRAVVLTFDDGRGTVWSVGYPLMRRHGMKGIVFLVPGRTVSRPGPLRATIDEVREGRARLDAVLGRERGDAPFLSWEEIEALDRSGLFDFQSHTLSHARIHTGPKVAGFLTPAMRSGYACMDVPLIHEDGRDRLAGELPLGTPLLRSEPRTSEALRFYEDAAVRTTCVATVEAEGGEGFFYRKGWEKRLRRFLEHHPIGGRTESAQEREAAIRTELADARRLIEERIGRAVVHLCYPWHASGPTARRLAREIGYRTAFCGKVPGVRITVPGGDPHAIARIGEDYVELLPGRGRADLSSVLRHKWTRRLRGGA
ncbi:MAG: polysaccharide deacetylase family protein [Acidobacteria bacterium]|nr:polysaccharide deacetylase family protein [Acidobacteriota bacterium]